jgi:hypothetical protein
MYVGANAFNTFIMRSPSSSALKRSRRASLGAPSFENNPSTVRAGGVSLSMLKCVPLVGLFILMSDVRAATIELNLTSSVTAGSYECEGGCPAIENELLTYVIAVPEFSVNAGDSVHANLAFDSGRYFDLLYDPGSPAFGTWGELILSNPFHPSYQTNIAFSFSLMDSFGQVLLGANEPTNGSTTGDVKGGVTISNQASDIRVYGLQMEFNNFTDPVGSLPLTFNAVKFRVYNTKFGLPFSVAPPVTVPGPSLYHCSWLVAFILLLVRQGKRKYHGASIRNIIQICLAPKCNSLPACSSAPKRRRRL